MFSECQPKRRQHANLRRSLYKIRSAHSQVSAEAVGIANLSQPSFMKNQSHKIMITGVPIIGFAMSPFTINAMTENERHETLHKGEVVTIEAYGQPIDLLYINLQDLRTMREYLNKMTLAVGDDFSTARDYAQRASNWSNTLLKNKKAFIIPGYQKGVVVQYDNTQRAIALKTDGKLLWVDRDYINPGPVQAIHIHHHHY